MKAVLRSLGEWFGAVLAVALAWGILALLWSFL